jgi:hypothetical protein
MVLAFLGARGSPSPVNGAGLFFFCKKERSAKLRMSRLVPATLFLRDSWVQIPPPALLVQESNTRFESVKLVAWGRPPLSGDVIKKALIGNIVWGSLIISHLAYS